MCVVTACLYTDRPVLPRIAGIMIWGMPFRSQCVMTNLWYEVTFDENGHMQFTLEPAWKRWVDPPDENAPLPDSLKRWWDPPEDGRPAAFKPGYFSPDWCGRCDWCGWWGKLDIDTEDVPLRYRLIQRPSETAVVPSETVVVCTWCRESPLIPLRCHDWLQPGRPSRWSDTNILRLLVEYLANQMRFNWNR